MEIDSNINDSSSHIIEKETKDEATHPGKEELPNVDGLSVIIPKPPINGTIHPSENLIHFVPESNKVIRHPSHFKVLIMVTILSTYYE